VVSNVDSKIERIIVVDDGCPEKSGELVEASVSDPRVSVLYNQKNMGVGAAVIVGYLECLKNGADVIVKIDGDGQMDQSYLANLIAPLLSGRADYSKGNRFFGLKEIKSMPAIRTIGNIGLSLLNKLSTGYWSILDPTNGYTAIHRDAISNLDLDEISRRYFFESDMLFHLGLIDAVVVDVPIPAIYGSEISNLKVGKSFFEFGFKHIKNLSKRVKYKYFLQNFTFASIGILFGPLLFVAGFTIGAYSWIHSLITNIPTQIGTQFFVVLAIISGIQGIAIFANQDSRDEPKV
jgi:glycosyltransferase involved in cell wall biosynthesis